MATDPTREEAEAYARQRARQYGVDEDLIVRQIGMESSWNPRAVSPAGARGYMQLMPGTAGDLGVNPDDWRQNIDGGVRYMSQQIEAFDGDLELAAAAYNAGPGNARKRGRDWSQYRPETQNYVRNLVGGGQDPAGSAAGGQGSTVTVDGVRYEGAQFDWAMAGKSPEELLAAGYQQAADGQWFMFDESLGSSVVPPEPPRPLDEAYQQRVNAREDAVLDQQQADLEARIVYAGMPTDALGAIAGDVGKGVFLESGQAIISGAKRGVNATLDLVEEVGDFLDRAVPLGGIQITDPETGALSVRYIGPGELREMGGGNLGRLPTGEAERPESVTGRFIEGAAQFVTGFAGGGQLLRGWQTVTRGGQIGKALVQGAIGDFAAFDGQEARLSNLLEEVAPEAIAPVFGYLAAREDDPELWGRAKNALEGGVLGVAVDGVTQGVRALKAARMVRDEARAAARAEGLAFDPAIPMEAAAREGEAARARVEEVLGNPEAPLFRVRRVNVTADEALGPGENLFDINLSRMNTPDDIKAAVTGMADKLAKDVDLARRAQQSWDQTREASGRVDWVQSMAARKRGQAMNAEEILAYRQALNASATRLVELAQTVKSPRSTRVDEYALRRAASVHAAIQNEFMGARAEAGRALQSFRIPADTPAQYLRQIDSLIADAGASDTARGLADALLKATQKGDAAFNEVVRMSWSARTREIIKLGYTNGLLSNIVGTPSVNLGGNTMTMMMNLAARSISPRLAGAFGGQSVTQIGEASAMAHGYVQAARDAFRLTPTEAYTRNVDAADAGQSPIIREGLFRGMAPGLDDAAPRGIELRAEREEAGMRTSRPLSAAAWGVAEDTKLGRLLDVLQMVVEAPSNLNQLTDDFFKVVAARGEIHAQAHRIVVREGLEGEALRARYASLLENPTDEMLEAAEREMHELTFTRETPGIAKGLSDIRRWMDSGTPIPFGTLVMPFLRTPANLISTGMRYSPLAPFSRRFRDDIAAGGEAAEIAKAKVALGSMLWSVWIGMALDGQITGAGPSNPGQRDALMRQGENGGQMFQPYSMRMGDRWYSFERMDPLGQMMGLIGDTADLFKVGDWNADRNVELDELVAHAVLAIGGAFFDKTVLRSVVEATQAVVGDQADSERFMQSQASALIGPSSLLRAIRRGEDKYLREVTSMADAIRNTIPGLSEGLPIQRDLWGRPRTYETGLGTTYDAFVPIQTRRRGGNLIDMEILDNGISIQMPNRSLSVNGETVSLKNRADIYSDFVGLAGEPAFQHLEAVVSGEHPDSEYYFSLSTGPEGERAEYIKTVIDDYRSAARLEILDLYGDELGQMATERVRRREEVRLDR